MSFTIRPARPDDVAGILAMICELAEFEQLSHLVTATEAKLADDLFGAAPACECIVGEADGQTVAFALYFHNYSTFLARRGLYLEDLYVRPVARGRGHARAMMTHLAQLARERGCGRFEWSVLDWNANAIAFYEAIGATVLPDWRICRVTGPALENLAGR
ncbi:GNAT family N-acetyltransferase [Jeongeupia sp. USM3]|uniref:GNAT family N-acetyltransferase n=1 Tax=Jeongeupia sp. USM3 TaxID=1906741 RepID=UPI00089E0285|nr:GNAT family N-acetyltransferase [Jeongeupia sp. USM3]AOX99700.1 GNAT family N-acetyltransferase [Jeongeupia sp. USM3]